MRVCMLTYSYYGFDSRVQQYARALVERGDEVDVIALRREGLPKHELVDGVNVYRIQHRARNERGQAAYFFRIVRFLLRAAFLLAWRQRTRPCQLIHVHSVPDFLVFAAVVPKLLGARVILDIHDILPEFYASKFHCRPGSRLFRLLLLAERLSVNFADYTIVANELWCERIRSRSARHGKCISIRNYPDPRRFYPRAQSVTNGKYLILYPGTLNSHQGLDVAIRAFAKVKDELPGAVFHIYGEGPARQSLLSLADRLALGGSVQFKDPVPADRIAEIMAQADLAVVPKRASSLFGNEAASTKIFEFIALGVPIVASRTRIDTHYLDDSMVKFFESENEDDLARSILTVARDPELRRRLAASASRYAAEHTWEEKKHEYLRLVDSLTGAGRRNP